MAEFIMKDLVAKAGVADQFEIASAATSTEEIGNNIHYGTRGILDKYKIPYSRRGARQMTARDYDEYDYLIGMDGYNMRNMERICGQKGEKLHKLLTFAGSDKDVADPWYTGNFEETYADVMTGCQALLDDILQEKRD